jgi:hypothetical protein
LKEVFNEDDNVILSDGSDWCLLWGWKFRNTQENYLSPEFMPKPIMQDANKGSASKNAPLGTRLSPLAVPLAAASNETDPNALNDKAALAKSAKQPLWVRIKRFLRTTVYRLWGLMFLIMFILFLMCLFKTCHNKRMQERCIELEKNNRSLLELQKKVQEKCVEDNK